MGNSPSFQAKNVIRSQENLRLSGILKGRCRVLESPASPQPVTCCFTFTWRTIVSPPTQTASLKTTALSFQCLRCYGTRPKHEFSSRCAALVTHTEVQQMFNGAFNTFTKWPWPVRGVTTTCNYRLETPTKISVRIPNAHLRNMRL
jgi:hypothetical protein